MEVHHHPKLHHKKSNFKEYFLEFVMIFLAVTMGFLAESYRERLLDREKEKQSIESLVQCLTSDTVQLKNIINANVRVVTHLDSFLLLKNADLSIQENKRNFLIHSLVGFNEDWFFRTNDAALQQLKSSGMLRLIHEQNIIDSIFEYESKNKAIVAQENDNYWLFKEDFLDYRRAVDLDFFADTTVLKYDLGYTNSSTVVLKDISGISISTDREKIKGLFGNAATLRMPEKAYIQLMHDQLSFGKRLIAFLKQEYRLE